MTIKDKINNKVRVRIAPSPTGLFHLGTARTALFNWLYAKHNNGVLILRIEDTDLERSDTKFELDIVNGLRWLGLNWDEGPTYESNKSGDNSDEISGYGPYRQCERMDIYEKYIKQLLSEQKAYYCYCTKDELDIERKIALSNKESTKYSGKCRSTTGLKAKNKPQLVRFKVEEKIVEFTDMIRGKISFDTKLIGDMAIAKVISNKNSDLSYSPLYNFAVTVDDATMDITHVIRGEDHIPNTPKQILIQEALGFALPCYAHLPLILSSDRSKLSKRYVETSLLMYKDQGFLPSAMANFIAYLGWHPKDEKEIMSLNEIASEFELERVQKAGAIFSEEKLLWFNAQYIKKLENSELASLIAPKLAEKGMNISLDKLQQVLNLEKDRMKTLEDFYTLSDFFFKLPEYNESLLFWKDISKEQLKSNLDAIKNVLGLIESNQFNSKNIEVALIELTNKHGKGAILWPLRASLSGKRESPGPFDIAELLGKDETAKRIDVAINKLK